MYGVPASPRGRAQGLWCPAQVCHDTVLEPLGRWRAEPTAGDYPPLKAGVQVRSSARIRLFATNTFTSGFLSAVFQAVP